MAKLIFSSRCICDAPPEHLQNYVRYISTREGVEKADESKKDLPATSAQNGSAVGAGLAVFHLCCKDKKALAVRPDFKHVLPVFRLGVTGIVQNGASAVSMFFIQGVINQFGINEISAYAAAYRIETILTFPFCASLYLLTNFLRGEGEIVYPVFNTMLELGARTVFAFVSVRYIGFYGIMLCRPLSFLISTVSLSCRYFTKNGRDGKE